MPISRGRASGANPLPGRHASIRPSLIATLLRVVAAIGRGYVAFARQNPGLFLLMFRSERLDFTRPSLRAAGEAAFGVLARAVGAQQPAHSNAPLTLAQAADITAAWSLVHGFAMLMLDGRLKPLIARTRGATDEMTLLGAILRTR